MLELIPKIEKLSKWSGIAVSWLILALVAELVYDTAARYLFNAPTVWSFDVSYMLYGTLFILGGAYTLHYKRHIRVDLLYTRLSKRGKAFVDLFGYLIFFFPIIGVLVIYGVLFTYESWVSMERASISYWAPILWWFKATIPLGGLLLLLQGIAEFSQVILDLCGGQLAGKET